MTNRIVNLRFTCCGLRFDAAIDCDWCLHAYDLDLFGIDEKKKNEQTPIELFCIDKQKWGIHMCYYTENACLSCNQQQNPRIYMANTLCSVEFIKNEARKWVREMRKQEEKH